MSGWHSWRIDFLTGGYFLWGLVPSGRSRAHLCLRAIASRSLVALTDSRLAGCLDGKCTRMRLRFGLWLIQKQTCHLEQRHKGKHRFCIWNFASINLYLVKFKKTLWPMIWFRWCHFLTGLRDRFFLLNNCCQRMIWDHPRENLFLKQLDSRDFPNQTRRMDASYLKWFLREWARP